MKKLRIYAVILIITVLTGFVVLPVSAGHVITIDLHIVGIDYSFYYDDLTMLDTTRHGWSVISLLSAARLEDSWVDISFKRSENGTYVTEVSGLREGDYGDNSRWHYLVNGKSSRLGMDEYLLTDGDQVVVYYADLTDKGMQYPEIEVTDGTPDDSYDYYVTFTSRDPGNGSGTNPIKDAIVMWGGTEYVTDSSGRIYIPGDLGPAGYHSVRIERYDEQTGVPTVLRYPPGYRVYVPYVDLPENAWYSEAVQDILFLGHMRGVGDNKFAPEKPMTFAELIVLLWRVAGRGYTPKPHVVWYEPALEWATNNGILFDDRYSINSNVTREIFLYMFYKTIMYRTPETPMPSTDITGAADYINVGANFRDAVSWAVALGVIKGASADRLVIDPDSEVTRAQVCQMLYNYYEYYRNEYWESVS